MASATSSAIVLTCMLSLNAKLICVSWSTQLWQGDTTIFAPVQMSAWRLGSSVEKPESVRISTQDKAVPDKFMTERVVLDDPAQATSKNVRLDIPDAPRVYLRRPGP